MSTGVAQGMTLAQAIRAAEFFVHALRLEGGYTVCGSIRRKKEVCNDIDLVVPLPDPRSVGDPHRDQVYMAIEDAFTRADQGGRLLWWQSDLLGRQVKGVRPGFKYCELVGSFEGVQVPIQIHRYVPGPLGNRGWIELMRTGPADFGPVFLGQWAKFNELPSGQQTSRDGYLLNREGDAVPTPTEDRCFAFAGLMSIPPEKRSVEAIFRSRCA